MTRKDGAEAHRGSRTQVRLPEQHGERTIFTLGASLMRNRSLLATLMLAAALPTLAMAQAEPAQREGSWEFSVGGGAMYTDGSFSHFLGNRGFANSATPSRVLPAAAGRLGYNFTNNVGFSIGAGGATGSGVKYLIPFAALTFTPNLNAKTNPFLTLGTQFTRVTGNNSRVTHPTWGSHVGLGVRHMMSDHLALRLEARMGIEHYAELPGRKTAYNSIATLGFSYFTAGHRAHRVVIAPPACPPYERARVDTIVRVFRDTVRQADTVLVPEQADQLVLRVQFETNKTALLPKSLPVLDTIAMAIIATPNSRWEVQGHTDSIGTDEANQILSEGRARTVVEYLVSRGVDRRILTAVGFGEKRPVFSNSTLAGRAQNRRVQLRRRPAPPTGPPIK
jgi:outer membrane protein OmpA-like peptidoglycan-associated protein